MVNDDLDPASEQHLRRAWARAGKPGVVNEERHLSLELPQDVLTAVATVLWERLPFKTTALLLLRLGRSPSRACWELLQVPYEHSPRTCTAGTVALPPARCLADGGQHYFT